MVERRVQGNSLKQLKLNVEMVVTVAISSKIMITARLKITSQSVMTIGSKIIEKMDGGGGLFLNRENNSLTLLTLAPKFNPKTKTKNEK